MNKRNAIKVGAFLVKIAALVMAGANLGELQAVLGENASLAALAFGGASAGKDVLVTILDYLDDGKRNNSWKGGGLPLVLLAGVCLLLLPSCVTDQGTALPVYAKQTDPGGSILVTPIVPTTIGPGIHNGILLLPAPLEVQEESGK